MLVADVAKTLARKSANDFVGNRELELKGIPGPFRAWELVIPSDQGIGVAIVEDHPLYRQGLMQTVESSAGLDLIAAADSLREMDASGYGGVQVALVDLHLPDGAGAEVVAHVKSRGPTRLVVSASDDRESVVDAIGAGASGHLPKSSTGEEIATATKTVAGGGTYVSPVLAAFLLRTDRDRTSEDAVLTKREREILSLLAEGETDFEIADRLFISIRTVRSHLDRIRDKR